MDNFHIFEDVYKILVKSINYVITEKNPNDQDLNDYLLSLLITKECIIMLSYDGCVNINKKFPDAFKEKSLISTSKKEKPFKLLYVIVVFS